MALQQRSDGTLVYVTGSMGSGKTTWVKQRVAASRRLLVWDGKGIDWGAREGCAVVTSLDQLRAMMFTPTHRLSVRVTISREHFTAFCRLAWVWARSKPGVLVVDEIADVTTTAKALTGWGEIARKSRAFGTDVYVTTQRPQEADKTAQGNAHLCHCGRMSDTDDQRYVARRLLGGIDASQVAALGPLEWIERDARSFAVTHGKVTFTARTAPRVKPAAAPLPPTIHATAPAPASKPLFDW